MIDEFGNDAPYDFKNIVSYTPAFEGGASYTFSGSSSDLTIGGHSYNNVIGQQIGTDGKHYIPYISIGAGGNGTFNCSIGSNVKYIYVPADCSNIHIGNDCSVITLGSWDYTSEVADVFIGNNCNGVNFEDDVYISFYTIAIGNSCTNINLISVGGEVEHVNIGNFCNDIEITNGYGNTIGNNCHDISCNVNCAFGNNCYNITCSPNNTFGDNCYIIECVNDNTFGNHCYSITCVSGNIFGNDCDTITCNSIDIFGNYCRSINCTDSNTFGNNCYNITCGTGNTFGNNCRVIHMTNTGSSNTFGQNCQNIYSGANSSWNTFGNYVGYIVFATSRSSSSAETNRRAYCQYNVLHDGVRYVVIYSTYIASSTAILRNVHIDTPATYARTSYKYTGASSTTGAAINTSSIQRYKFTASDTTTTLS
jgi:hypothetical protein